ncbi:MAG: NADH-quinone oxidoreductase subunit N [Nitrospirota bacterium]
MEFNLAFSFSDLWLLLPELLLLGLICVVLVVDFSFPKVSKNTLAWVTVAGLCGVLASLAWMWGNDVQGALFKQTFVLDPFAVFFKIIVVLSTILIVLASLDYIKRIVLFRGEYYLMVLLSALGMLFMASANDLLTMFITIEFSTFGFYILVAYLREDNLFSSEAGLKFFVLSVFTAAIMVFGISLIYGETGTIIFPEIAAAKPVLTGGLVIGFLCLIVGLGFKIGAFPFHNWIPDIYQGAPTPITAYLGIAPKAAALAIVLRVFFSTFAQFKPEWVWLLIGMAALSMTYGNIVAIAQTDIKRMLAYSGIAQMGNILIGLAAGTKMGGDSVLFYLLAYLMANVGAFAVVIIFSNLTGSDRIEDYRGLARRAPFLAAAMLVFLLSLAGVPPFAGFIAKIYVFAAAMKQGLIALVCVGLVNIVISMYYYIVIVKKMYINEPTDRRPIPVSASMQAVVLATLAGTVILGIYPGPFIEWAVSSTALFAGLVGP